MLGEITQLVFGVAVREGSRRRARLGWRGGVGSDSGAACPADPPTGHSLPRWRVGGSRPSDRPENVAHAAKEPSAIRQATDRQTLVLTGWRINDLARESTYGIILPLLNIMHIVGFELCIAQSVIDLQND